MPKQRSWTDEQLTRAVEQSKSVRGVFDFIGPYSCRRELRAGEPCDRKINA